MPDVMKTVGRYEILREVGRGGMAMVYLARQTDLDRFVALKELGAFHASDPSFAQRFLRESRVAGSLSHPNIVTVHDYFEHDGTPYIAMEYVERGSLRPHVGRMTLAQSAGVLEGLLAGLAHAESHGIVHRDLKPENLMVTADGRVKIADFGIAKATTKMQTGAFLTATGTTVGTPTYMAPEQAMAQDIGPWTDLYSVGCMAFEMFTGRVPFHDSDAPMAILLRHVNEPIPPVKSIEPEVDQSISDWIERLLVKDPGQRTQSANEAWDAFEEIVIALLGPRWRREARLLQRVEAVDTPKPLTPAPFEGTNVDGAVSDEFQSFAWGTPGSDTGDAAVPMYTPPPQSVPDIPEPVVGPPTPEPSAVVPAPSPPVEAETPAAEVQAPAVEEAPTDESGFLTFGAPAPPPPTDALVAPPPAEVPEPVAAPEPVVDEPAFETYVAPPPPRPPSEEPAAVTPPPVAAAAVEPAPVEPEPVAGAPEPVAAAPVVEPGPVAGEPAATVMPQALAAEPAVAEPPRPPRTPSAERGEPSRRRPLPFILIGAAVVVVAVIVIVVAGGSGPKKASSNTPKTTAGRPVTATGAGMTVQLPAGWARSATAGSVPGLALADQVAMAPAKGGEGVLFGRANGTARNSTLLPTGFLRSLASVPQRTKLQLNPATQAFRYQDVAVSGGKVTLFAVPTTQGVALLACTGALPAAQCDAAAGTIRITQGQALPVGPSNAYRQKVVATLNRLAKQLQRALGSLKAKTPQAQARAAAAISGDYAAAAKALGTKTASPFDQEANTQLVGALKSTSKAFGRAATAARHNDAGAFKRASKQIVGAQKSLATALAALGKIGYALPGGAVRTSAGATPLPALTKKPHKQPSGGGTQSVTPPVTQTATPPPTNTTPTTPTPPPGGGGGGGGGGTGGGGGGTVGGGGGGTVGGGGGGTVGGGGSSG